GRIVDVIGAGDGHRSRNRRQDAQPAQAFMVVDVVRAFRTDHGDRAGVLGKPALDMQRLPRTRCLVFRDQVAELRRRAKRRHVAQRRNCAADIHQRQADRAAYRRVAARARAERVMPRIDAELERDRAVDYHERRAQMRGRLHAVQVERLVAHRLDREHEQRKIIRRAPRHYGISREAQWRRFAIARRHFRDRLIPRPVAVSEHCFHALGGRRNDRQAVAPSALHVQPVDRVEIVVRVDARVLGIQEVGEIAHYMCSLMSLTSCGNATCARPSTCSSDKPPSGCAIFTSGRSGVPNTLDCVVPSLMNGSDTMTAVTSPRLRNSDMSWTLHDVQDPQSPIALTTKSASFASWSSMLSGAGRLTLSLRSMTTDATGTIPFTPSTMNFSR